MLPSANWLDSGSQHSFAFASLLIVDESRSYAWSSTAGLSMLRESSLTINESGNIIGGYNYQVRIITDGGSYNVTTATNSTISDFIFDRANKEITFKITGTEGTAGFCRICIPTALMNAPYKVYVNGTEVSYNLLPCSNETYSYLYFNYTHSTEEVIIIPQFPSFLVLPFFMIMTLLAVIAYKRKKPI
jgi:hypothetical protein